MKSIFETPFSWRVSNVSQSAMQASFVCTSIHPSYARSLARSLGVHMSRVHHDFYIRAGGTDATDGRTGGRQRVGRRTEPAVAFHGPA